MNFPNGKKFAFTIIDDTDGDLLGNTRPVYEYLDKLGIRTTKTVWALPPKDSFKGLSLKNYRYRQYIKKLQKQGFEIALHSVGSGEFNRQDIIDGLEIFKQFIGHYPKIQINHAQNPDSIYWGIKRLTLLKPFWRWSKFYGDNQKSAYFWGDYHKKYIKYTRNFTFNNLNVSHVDKLMPYKDPCKLFANYWFSASDTPDVKKFIELTSPKKIDRLMRENGSAIIFTHFALGFVKNGQLNKEFQKNLVYITQKEGYFVPAGELLDHLLKFKKKEIMRARDIYKLELKWLWDKSLEKLFSFR